MEARKRVPSRALLVGGLVGAPIGPVVVQAAQEFGVNIGPATAALGGSLLSLLFAYFSKGGRRGESH